MKITIEYEASWRNSFLDPATSNNEPLPKNGRKFVGSMTNLKNEINFMPREVTIDTVMGVLNRLIGDQRKLYQSRDSDSYYFKGLESKVTFTDTPRVINSEIAYIRNTTGSTDQNSYTGMIKVNDAAFTSEFSNELWSVLNADVEQICQFITASDPVETTIELNPLVIIGRLEEINKIKALPKEGAVEQAFSHLKAHFEDYKGVTKKDEVMPISLYCSALYLQIERLNERYDLSPILTKSGGLSGISKNGVTKKDFMSRYTTGEKKKIWGNPYLRDEFVKGEGKTTHRLTKANGTLEIQLEIPREEATKIHSDIQNAGVSAFYLGKKGLAYISDIRI